MDNYNKIQPLTINPIRHSSNILLRQRLYNIEMNVGFIKFAYAKSTHLHNFKIKQQSAIRFQRSPLFISKDRVKVDFCRRI